MSTPFPFAHRGFVLDTDVIPHGFLRRLEAEGLASMTARTVEGAYLEPRVPLSQLLARFDLAGVRVFGVRQAGQPACWRRMARPAAEWRQRLRSPRCAEWLPTLPAA